MAAVDQVAVAVPGPVPAAPGVKTSVVGQKRGTTATQRLKQDYMRIMKDPVPYVTAHPLPANILEWYVGLLRPINIYYREVNESIDMITVATIIDPLTTFS